MGQSGEDMKRLDSESMRDLSDDKLETNYQQAVKWRHRIKSAYTCDMVDQTQGTVLLHFDHLVEACNKWRGLYLDLKGKEEDRLHKLRKRRDRERKKVYNARKRK